MDCLPQTQAALAEHIKRAAYQAGHVWVQMFSGIPNLPSPIVNGVSYKEQMQAGKLHGQHLQRLHKPVVNYFDVDARKGAGRNVSVSTLLYNILLCALVMGYAIKR